MPPVSPPQSLLFVVVGAATTGVGGRYVLAHATAATVVEGVVVHRVTLVVVTNVAMPHRCVCRPCPY